MTTSILSFPAAIMEGGADQVFTVTLESHNESEGECVSMRVIVVLQGGHGLSGQVGAATPSHSVVTQTTRQTATFRHLHAIKTG